MKKFLFSLLFVFSLNIVFAQSPLMATLDHNGEITHFFSTNALVNAMKVAQDGDIITLSSGAFVGTDISKSITLRGSAMDNMYGDNTRTIINDNTNITATDTSHYITIENIRFSNYLDISGGCTKNMKIKKCYIGTFSQSAKCQIYGLTIENCRIETLQAYKGSSYSQLFTDFQLINSIIGNLYTSIDRTLIVNCTIGRQPGSMQNCEIWNSVIVDTGSSSLHQSSTAYNCLGYTTSSSSTYKMFPNLTDITNWQLKKSEASIFLDERINSSYNAGYYSYELVDAIKNTYLGTDGTEVGMYGGFLPYTTRPSGPKITKCNVAQKSTIDGKLSVEIEVVTQE